MPNQIAAWQLDVALGLTFAVLIKNGEALLWTVVFFHISTYTVYVDGETDIVKVASPTIYMPGLSAGVRW